MAGNSEILLRYIRRLGGRPGRDGACDAALLGRFISERDEKAFAALVDRHGRLVLQVCRRVLGDVDDAEDAFQAAFLVLARKAATVHPREALAAWLHGVAHRVALKSRSARVRRFREAQPLTEHPADPQLDPLAQLSARELLAVVDEEVRRLPQVYRLPVILCCLEGRSQEEAARQLGWTPGSVKGRLERGRARLHDQLVRRGLTLSAALAAAEVSRGAVSAAAVGGLVAATVRGAVAFGAGQTAGVEGASVAAAALAQETLVRMALAKLKMAVALLVPICVLGIGFGIHRAAHQMYTRIEDGRSRIEELHPRSSILDPPSSIRLAPPAALASNRLAVSRDETDAQINVSGRVLDPNGRPIAGAKLYLGYSVHRFALDIHAVQPAYAPRATSETDGRFHFAFTISELDARWLDGWRAGVLAVAGGYGPDWAEIGESGKVAELSLKLVEDLPLKGRILDANRQPIAGAKILVSGVISDSEEAVTQFLQRSTNPRSWYPKSWRGPLPGQPARVTTDADGRFQLAGLGRNRLVALVLVGPGIQHTIFQAATCPAAAIPPSRGILGDTFDYLARPGRSIRGVVHDQATGKPVAGVKMSEQQSISTTLTDENGRFEIAGCPQEQGYLVMAQPQPGQPCFAASASVPGAPGLDAITVNFDLVTGIPLSGRVTDQATQKPPKTAVVEYYPLFPNPHGSRITNPPSQPASSTVIQPDGSYHLPILPGPGVVCVAVSPRNSYAVARVDDKDLADLFQDGQNHGGTNDLLTSGGLYGRGRMCVNQYNVLSLINPNDRAEFLTLDLTLQPAVRLKGTVVGPDGKPLTGVNVTGLSAMPSDELLESASFTVRGLNPLRSRNLFFYHRIQGLGKVLTISRDQTEPLTVQLDPCGSVVGRIVNKGGKPVPGARVSLYARGGCLEAMAESDGEGRFRVALLPGQKYSLSLVTTGRLLPGFMDVEVESGRIKDLGDLPLGD